MSEDLVRQAGVHPLAYARGQRGWTQDRLAAELRSRGRGKGIGLATTKKTVAKWEHGVRPDNATQTLLAEALGVDPGRAESSSWPMWLPTGGVAGLAEEWGSRSESMEALDRMLRAAYFDDRQFPALTGFAIQRPLYEWLTSSSPALTAAISGSAVDEVIVESMRNLISTGRLLGERYGGGACAALGHARLEVVTEIIKRGSYGSQVGEQLFDVAGELAQQAAWVCFDTGRHAAAQQYWLMALRMAHLARNRSLSANIISFLSYQAYSVGNSKDADWLIRFVLDRIKPEMTPRLAAHIHGRHALAASLARRSTDCTRAIESALCAIEESHGIEQSWTSWIDRAQIYGMCGRAFLQLGDTQQATRHLTKAMEQNSPTSRSQVLYLAQTASTALIDRDLLTRN